MTDHGIKNLQISPKPLHIRTPLLESVPLSKLTGFPVYLKCENCQPSGSFKLRGMGHKVQTAFADGFNNLVTASGGNAGLAVAYACRKLGITANIVIPISSPKNVGEKLLDLDAKVIVHDGPYDEANALAKEIGSKPGFTYIHAYDDPVIWEGHTGMITEIQEQLGGVKPRCVVVAVGGGGLLVGVIQGLKKVGWGDVPVVAMETYGAESFYKAIEAKNLITLPAITSICHTLGASTVCRRSYELAVNKEHPIISRVVSDDDALDSVYNFLEHHHFLVEPSCGAGLSALYTGVVQRLVSEGELPSSGPVVAIVCGGVGSTLSQLAKWRQEVADKKKDRHH